MAHGYEQEYRGRCPRESVTEFWVGAAQPPVSEARTIDPVCDRLHLAHGLGSNGGFMATFCCTSTKSRVMVLFLEQFAES